MSGYKLCKRCAKCLEQRGNRPRLYCDDACRKAFMRHGQSITEENQSERKRTTQSGQSLSGQPKADTPTMHEQQCAANNQTRSKTDQHAINTGPPKSFDELDAGEHNRVSLPGDDDYDGCVTVQAGVGYDSKQYSDKRYGL